MKKLLCTAAVGMFIFNQAQQAGVYRNDANQNEMNVEITDSGATITGWNFTLPMTKNADGKYISQYGDVMESGDADKMLLTSGKGFKESFSMYAPLNYTLPEGVTEFSKDGKKYFAIAAKEEPGIVGEYLYEGNKEPKALLSADGSGYFQRHGVAPTPIVWWGIETNYKGEIQKLVGETGNYKMIIAVKYDDGTFDRLQTVVLPGERKSYLLGERIMSW